MREPATTPARRTVALVMLLGWMLLIFGGSSGPAPKSLVSLHIPDAILHGIEYGVLGFLASRWLLHRTLRTSVLVLVVLPAAIAAVYGATDEFHQSFTGRDPELADLAADALGGVMGSTFYRLLLLRSLRPRTAGAAALLALALLAPGATAAPTDDPLAAGAASITREGVGVHADFLSGDELRGRDAPSWELDVSARYIAEHFRSWGLEPGGEGGTFFQRLPMYRRFDEGGSFVRVLTGAEPAEYRGHEIGLRNDAPDGEGAGPVVFAGYGIVAPKLGRNDYEGIDVRGRVVLLLEGCPGAKDRKNPFRSARDPEVRAQIRLPVKVRNAAGRGAVAVIALRGPGEGTTDRLRLADGGVLEGAVTKVSGGYRIEIRRFHRERLAVGGIDRVVEKDGREVFPRAATEDERLTVLTDREIRFVRLDEVARVEQGVVPLPKGSLSPRFGSREPPSEGIPVLQLSAEGAARLLEGSGRDLAGLEKELAGRTASFEMPDRVAVVRVRTRTEKRFVRNVIGRRPGRERRDEALVLSAHYDHLGVSRDGEVMNGADDNASGTATVLAVARAFSRAGLVPRRDVWFVAAAAEEKGLVGSRYLVAHPPLPLDDVLANLNLDMVGRGTADEIDVHVGPLGTDLARILEEAAHAARIRPAMHVGAAPPGGLPPRTGRAKLDLPVPRTPQNLFGRSDQASFYRHGIPAAFFFSGFHEDYHRPTDDFAKLNLEKMARIGRMVFRASFDLAEDGLHRR